jgi:peptide/nickel transport system permease protein
VAAAARGSLWDRLALGFSFLGQSAPPFLIAIVGVLLFAVLLRWLPSGGIGPWPHYVLPSLVLAWTISAGIARLVRSSMLETLDTPYVMFARLKGLGEASVLVKHALLNALIPVVTFTGLMYGTIVASAVAVEVVFAWPGLGQLAYQAILWRDFPVLQATVLMWTVLIIAVNFAVDAIYFLVDPKVRE